MPKRFRICYEYLTEKEQPCRVALTIRSKHLHGAIRKLYQTAKHTIDSVVYAYQI